MKPLLPNRHAHALCAITRGLLELIPDNVSDPIHGDAHYGLKIAGDVVSALTNATWLSWDATNLTRTVSIFQAGGYTYVAVPPPAGTLLIVR